MQPHSPLWHYLWLGPHLWQVLIAVLMVRRRLHREYPIFFAYTILQIILNPVLFVLDHRRDVAAITYWRVHYAGLLISAGLRFGIIHELYRYVLQPYPVLAKLSSRVLRWSAVVLVFVAVLASAYFPWNDVPLFAGINTLDRGVALMQAGLLSVILLFSSYFRLSWKNYAFGIAAGMGIFSAVDLARSSMRIALGPSYLFDFVSMSVYQICVFVWLAYLLAPAPAQKPVKQVPDHNLQEWNNELQRFLAR
jgi:hypothetical protein